MRIDIPHRLNDVRDFVATRVERPFRHVTIGILAARRAHGFSKSPTGPLTDSNRNLDR